MLNQHLVNFVVCLVGKTSNKKYLAKSNQFFSKWCKLYTNNKANGQNSKFSFDRNL